MILKHKIGRRQTVFARILAAAVFALNRHGPEKPLRAFSAAGSASACGNACSSLVIRYRYSAKRLIIRGLASTSEMPFYSCRKALKQRSPGFSMPTIVRFANVLTWLAKISAPQKEHDLSCQKFRNTLFQSTSTEGVTQLPFCMIESSNQKDTLTPVT